MYVTNRPSSRLAAAAAVAAAAPHPRLSRRRLSHPKHVKTYQTMRSHSNLSRPLSFR